MPDLVRKMGWKYLSIALTLRFLLSNLTAQFLRDGVNPINCFADSTAADIKDRVIEGNKIFRTAKLKVFHDTISLENWKITF